MKKRLYILLISAVVSAAGCRSPDPEEAALLGFVDRGPPSTWMALDSLSIAAPLSETPWAGGECEELPPPPTSQVSKLLSVVWREGRTQDRRVTVNIDEMGRPIGYSDARRGLATIVANPNPDAPVPPGTLIVLSLEGERATVENRFGNGDFERVSVDFGEALESAKLGNPAQIMKEILDRCGGFMGVNGS